MYFSDKKMDNITFFDYIWNDFNYDSKIINN